MGHCFGNVLILGSLPTIDSIESIELYNGRLLGTNSHWIKEALWSQEKGSSSSKPKKMVFFHFAFEARRKVRVQAPFHMLHQT